MKKRVDKSSFVVSRDLLFGCARTLLFPETKVSDLDFLIAIALKSEPEETLRSFSYSKKLLVSTHEAIMDDKSADEKDGKEEKEEISDVHIDERSDFADLSSPFT